MLRGRPTAVYLGITMLTSLVVLAVSGIVLSIVYSPQPHRAHAAIAGLGPWMSWLRSVHSWSATIILALALAHVTAAWIRGGPAWRRWPTGLVAAALMLAWFYTGTILAWDQRGWEALQHGGWALEAARLPAPDTVDPSNAPLGLTFWSHALALPLIAAVAIGAHLGGGRVITGVRRALLHVSADPRMAVGMALAAALAALLAPPALGPAPISDLSISLPRWPFLWLVPVQDVFGPIGMWMLPLAFLAGAGVFAAADRFSTKIRTMLAIGALGMLFVTSLIALRGGR